MDIFKLIYYGHLIVMCKNVKQNQNMLNDNTIDEKTTDLLVINVWVQMWYHAYSFTLFVYNSL